ncbi:uncharacterized protein LOC126369135 [Pectinophora gossypiella]|uniref:uncharacterized protein LOC126369135 n=1 Tax=Pectinophora gossypiella TaxID=13191 RepID=UPI00214E64A4|nr:uncharacterized protein LOC126369135 [Pectinophora gossypiella]
MLSNFPSILNRWKRGVLATIWLVVRGRRGVELEAFPDQQAHSIADCSAIQNAVDFHLDHLGNLWVLDTGVVDALERPRCTCPPKVVVISITLRRLTKHIQLTSIEASSLLQNIVVEHGIGKAFVYISDASRGAVLVHDTSSDAQWSVIVCAPAPALQLALVKRTTHTVLIIARLHQQGLLELDTATFKRRNSLSPLSVFGEHSTPVIILGSDFHHVYLRHSCCCDVLGWNTREVYNSSRLENFHSPGPGLTPTSVTRDPFKHVLLVLDSNYADTVSSKTATYHRITFIDQW